MSDSGKDGGVINGGLDGQIKIDSNVSVSKRRVEGLGL